MCGRFTLTAPGEVVAELFELTEPPELIPRYNIAPTQPVAAVLATPQQPTPRLEMLRWGLIPFWADDPSIGSRLINARSETAATKPAFRAAFRHRRCLVAADGFYEWQKSGRQKQPYYIRITDGAPFAFAGLWEHWESADGSAIDSCTLLTTESNELIRPLHDRMPVIIAPQDYAAWLDPSPRQAGSLAPLLHPYPAASMSAQAVGIVVNSPANDSPACIEPLL